MRVTQLTLPSNLKLALLPILSVVQRSNANDLKTRADSSTASQVLLSPEFGIYSLGSWGSRRLEDRNFGVGVVICHA